MADDAPWTRPDDELVRGALAALRGQSDLVAMPAPSEIRGGASSTVRKVRRRPAAAWAGGVAAAAAVCAVVYLTAQGPGHDVVPAAPGSTARTAAPTSTPARTPSHAPPRRMPTRPSRTTPHTLPFTVPSDDWRVIPLPLHPAPTSPGNVLPPGNHRMPREPTRVPDVRILPAEPGSGTPGQPAK